MMYKIISIQPVYSERTRIQKDFNLPRLARQSGIVPFKVLKLLNEARTFLADLFDPNGNALIPPKTSPEILAGIYLMHGMNGKIGRSLAHHTITPVQFLQAVDILQDAGCITPNETKPLKMTYTPNIRRPKSRYLAGKLPKRFHTPQHIRARKTLDEIELSYKVYQLITKPNISAEDVAKVLEIFEKLDSLSTAYQDGLKNRGTYIEHKIKTYFIEIEKTAQIKEQLIQTAIARGHIELALELSLQTIKKAYAPNKLITRLAIKFIQNNHINHANQLIQKLNRFKTGYYEGLVQIEFEKTKLDIFEPNDPMWNNFAQDKATECNVILSARICNLIQLGKFNEAMYLQKQMDTSIAPTDDGPEQSLFNSYNQNMRRIIVECIKNQYYDLANTLIPHLEPENSDYQWSLVDPVIAFLIADELNYCKDWILQITKPNIKIYLATKCAENEFYEIANTIKNTLSQDPKQFTICQIELVKEYIKKERFNDALLLFAQIGWSNDNITDAAPIIAMLIQANKNDWVAYFLLCLESHKILVLFDTLIPKFPTDMLEISRKISNKIEDEIKLLDAIVTTFEQYGLIQEVNQIDEWITLLKSKRMAKLHEKIRAGAKKRRSPGLELLRKRERPPAIKGLNLLIEARLFLEKLRPPSDVMFSHVAMTPEIIAGLLLGNKKLIPSAKKSIHDHTMTAVRFLKAIEILWEQGFLSLNDRSLLSNIYLPTKNDQVPLYSDHGLPVTLSDWTYTEIEKTKMEIDLGCLFYKIILSPKTPGKHIETLEAPFKTALAIFRKLDSLRPEKRPVKDPTCPLTTNMSYEEHTTCSIKEQLIQKTLDIGNYPLALKLALQTTEQLLYPNPVIQRLAIKFIQKNQLASADLLIKRLLRNKAEYVETLRKVELEKAKQGHFDPENPMWGGAAIARPQYNYQLSRQIWDFIQQGNIAEARFRLGQMNTFHHSEDDALDIICLDSHNFNLRYVIMECIKSDRYDLATEMLDMLIDTYPDYIRSLRGPIIEFLKKGQWKAAKKWIKKISCDEQKSRLAVHCYKNNVFITDLETAFGIDPKSEKYNTTKLQIARELVQKKAYPETLKLYTEINWKGTENAFYVVMPILDLIDAKEIDWAFECAKHLNSTGSNQLIGYLMWQQEWLFRKHPDRILELAEKVTDPKQLEMLASKFNLTPRSVSFA